MAKNLDFGSLRLTLAVKHYGRSRLASRPDLPSQRDIAVVVSMRDGDLASALIDAKIHHGPGLGRHFDCRHFSRMNGDWKPSPLRLKRQ